MKYFIWHQWLSPAVLAPWETNLGKKKKKASPYHRNNHKKKDWRYSSSCRVPA